MTAKRRRQGFVALGASFAEGAPGNSSALREHEYLRMLKTLLANIDGIVYRCRDDAQHTLEFASQGCLRRHRLRRDRSCCTTAPSSLSPSSTRMTSCGWPRPCALALKEQRAFDLEYRLVHADGSVRWVWDRGMGVYDAAGNVLAIEGLVHDVTSRKEAEQGLREAERRYRGLFDNALEGIFRTTLEGRYLGANPALANIYGFDSPEELIASLQNIGSQLYVDPERREEFMRIITSRGSVSGFESQVYRKNGEIIWISENARVIADDDGDAARLRRHRRGHHRAQALSVPHRAAGQLRCADRACEPLTAAGSPAAGDPDRRQLQHAPRRRLHRPGPLQVHQRQSRASCRR